MKTWTCIGPGWVSTYRPLTGSKVVKKGTPSALLSQKIPTNQDIKNAYQRMGQLEVYIVGWAGVDGQGILSTFLRNPCGIYSTFCVSAGPLGER